MDRWQTKIDALRRLIAPGSGATDGERAAAKNRLEAILVQQFGQEEGKHRAHQFYVHIEADPSAFDEALAQAFTTADYVKMKRAGIDMSGEWTAPTVEQAMSKMALDLASRRIADLVLAGGFND